MDESTREHYARVADSLNRRYSTETGLAWRDNPIAFVEWCGELRPTLTKSTWRLYRSAIVWFMREKGPVEAVERAMELSTAPCRKSHHRRGRLPADELQKVVDGLLARGDKYDLMAVNLLYATRATGLRPRQEWHGARLTKEPDHWKLVVINAKHDGVRANGETRTLLLSFDMPKRDIDAVCEVVGAVNSMSHAEWVEFYETSRMRVQRARKPGSRVTFYSARHQFVADCKAQGLSRAEVAALLGHASEDTANRHYGRRVHGNRRVCVNALADEVATVRPAKHANPRHDKRG